MLMNASGHLQVTVVDGTTLTGIFAADGSLNVFDATNETGFVGLQHPCGAINCVSSSGTTLTGAQAPNGAYYVVNDSAEIGLRHSSGGLCVTGFTTMEAVSFLSTWGPYGMVMDFSDASIAIKESSGVLDFTSQGQISNGLPVGPGAKTTYSGPSLKLTEQADGVLRFNAHNLYLNNGSPANQSITVLSGASYEIKITGSVSITLSGAATGTVTAGTTAFTAATGTLTCGSTSGSGKVYVRRTPCNQLDIDTAGAAAYDLPYVYSGGERTGIMVEPAATNLCLHSNDLTQSVWVKTNTTAGKTATGPDGVANSASTLTASSANGTCYQRLGASSSARSGQVFLKRRTGTGAVSIAIGNTTGSVIFSDDFSYANTAAMLAVWTDQASAPSTTTLSGGAALFTGVSGTNAGMGRLLSASLTVGKLYRFSLDVTATAGAVFVEFATSISGAGQSWTASVGSQSQTFVATATSMYVRFYTGGGSNTVTVDNMTLFEAEETTVDLSGGGWVVARVENKTLINPCVAVKIASSGDAVDVAYCSNEAGTVATSPTITYGASVLRAADNIYLDATLLPSSSENTLYAAFTKRTASVRGVAVSYGNAGAGSSTGFAIDGHSDGQVRTYSENAGAEVSYFLTMGAYTANTSIRAAFASETNNANASYNGSIGTDDTTATLPTGMTRLGVGSMQNSAGAAGTLQVNGLITVIACLSERKANATLQAMTTA